MSESGIGAKFDVTLAPLVWRPESVADALRALARAAGLAVVPATGASPPGPGPIADLASDLGLEAEARDVAGQRPVADQLRQALAHGPVLVHLPGAAGGGWLAIHGVRGARVKLIGPAGRASAPLTAVEDALWIGVGGEAGPALGPARTALAPLFSEGRRATEAARVLLGPRLGHQLLAEAWLLRAPASTLRQDLALVGAGARATAIALAYVAQMLVFVALWRAVGQRALANGPPGATTRGGLFALLALWAALQLGAARALRRLALDAGAVVRVWLLRGALRLDPEHIRDAGVGQLLGRALDAEALDGLALGGGAEALAGLFELLFGVAVLALGLAPAPTLGVLALAIVALVFTLRAQAGRHDQWSAGRRALTHDLVERMVGHRTLLVQDHPARRAAEDDQALSHYQARTRRLDRVATWAEVGLPRAFLLLALGAIGASLAGAPGVPSEGTMALVATALGGAWLAYSGLRRIGAAAGDLIAARDAWARVRPLIGAAPDAPATAARPAPAPTDATPVIAGHDLEYRYPRRPRPQLAGAALAIAPGERVLVTGPSGAGKSTLAALLTGLKQPTAGRLLLHGRDQQSVGLPRWRRAIGAVPHFHENHVFGADLLFNLLLGRRWPPRAEDIALAEALCRELGLGALLARMPAGLQQAVGETGWQLSHGERSRLFVARSLLQALEARVLDESFAALDPETLDEVMAAVLRRPEALVVIAHP